MKWFRCYTDIIDDHKINIMSAEAFKVMMFIFAYCSEQDNDGIITEDAEKLMWRLRYLDENQQVIFNQSIGELIDLRVLDVDEGTDCLIVLNWNTRQYKSDSSAERVRKHRAKKKASVLGDKANLCSDVTIDVTSNVTPSETDTDKKQNKKEKIINSKKNFITMVNDYKEKNKKTELNDILIGEFISYWTELNPSGTKMRYQSEKFFDVGRRLSTWNRKAKEYKDKYGGKKPIKADFRLDRTGNAYIARCVKCNKTDFYSKFEPMDKSRCCDGILEPDQKN